MSAGGGGELPGEARMARRHSGAATRDELAPGMLMRALGVGVEDEGAAAGERADPAPSAARARLAVAGVIAGTALLAGVLGPGAGAGRNSAESGANVPAAAGVAGSVESQGDSFVKTKKFGSDVVLGAAAAAAVSMSALAGDAVQWRVEDGGNGHWYRIDSIDADADYQSKVDYAHSRGATLTSISDSKENQFVSMAAQTSGVTCRLVIGGRRSCVSCNWNWIDGSAWTYSNWGSGEPGNGGAVHAEMFVGFGQPGSWADVDDADGSCPQMMLEWSADCNSDGIVDYGQILSGQLADANTNGIPDMCECATHPELGACRCAGDVVNDGTVNGADLGTLLAYWGPTTSGAFSQASDINYDGRVDGSDLGVLLSNWGACQPPAVTVPGWATLIEAIPDPAVVSDPALRTAIAATGLAWRVRDTGTGIEMLLVPPGTFQMGCVMGSNAFPCDPRELPVRQVSLTNSMYLGRYELTQGQWSAQMGSNPSYFRGFNDSSTRPVETVSWNDIQDYLTATGFRLPSEAEWEFSCRAGTLTPFYNGSSDDNTLAEIAWCSVNSGNQTHSVGSRIANALGFSDMLGNVSEWTNDWYGTYSSGAQVNPTGPATGTQRVIRGGAWTPGAAYVRSSDRDDVPAANVDVVIGFRVARDP